MKEINNNDFLCPNCKGHLNAGGHIIFSTQNQKKQKGLILLNPNIGSYDYQHHENYSFKNDEMIDFYCPICNTSLDSNRNENYAGITMIDHNNQAYDILFSRKAGDKSTYVVAQESVEIFGEDALNFEDIFDEY